MDAVMACRIGPVEAHHAGDLRERLDALGTPASNLGGPIEGSWDSIVVYLDAYLDTYPRKTAGDALEDAGLNERVLGALKEIGSACTAGGDDLCDETGWDVIADFGTGELDALIGYSEKLNGALRGDKATVRPEDVYIGPAPLGGSARTFLFTDALVKSPKCVDRSCKRAAAIFAEYYVSDEILAAAMMAADGGEGAFPRYLLPATEGAFNVDLVKEDPIYRQLRPLMATAAGYPNTGVPEARDQGLLRVRVNEAMGQCPGLLCNAPGTKSE
jgi:thiamine pyridinylase